MSRIDRNSIQDRPDLWLTAAHKHLQLKLGSEESRIWFKAMLRGLDRSGVAKELDQFARFVQSVCELSHLPLIKRMQEAAPSLHFPRNCFEKVPKVGSKLTGSELTRRLRSAFRNAENDVASFTYLLNKKEERIDLEAVRGTLNRVCVESSERDMRWQARATRDLLDDWKYVRHGQWRPSQEKFCQSVDWRNNGKDWFRATGKKKSSELGAMTSELIEREYPEDLKEEKDYLKQLDSGKTSSSQDSEFYSRWEDKFMATKGRAVYNSWRRRLFASNFKCTDLSTGILESVVGLLVKVHDEAQSKLELKRIRITRRNAKKASVWESLDKDFYRLLRLEVQLL